MSRFKVVQLRMSMNYCNAVPERHTGIATNAQQDRDKTCRHLELVHVGDKTRVTSVRWAWHQPCGMASRGLGDFLALTARWHR